MTFPNRLWTRTGWSSHRQRGRSELRREGSVDLGALQRHFVSTSSCGICAARRLSGTRTRDTASESAFQDSNRALTRLPEALRSAQRFRPHWRLHAAGLFDANGTLVHCERISPAQRRRKAIGDASSRMPAVVRRASFCLSGDAGNSRSSRSARRRRADPCTVSAPSSLAVEMARAGGLTLVGFSASGDSWCTLIRAASRFDAIPVWRPRLCERRIRHGSFHDDENRHQPAPRH